MSTGNLSRAQRKAIAEGKVVETINSLNRTDFENRFLNAEKLTTASHEIYKCMDREVKIDFLFPISLQGSGSHILDACFALIEESSADAYKVSEMRWSPSSKRKEMLLPDMRYLVIRDISREPENLQQRGEAASTTSSQQKILGFISFMITYEDGFEVNYIYEIHLAKELRGQGIGTVLMDIVEDIGAMAGVQKCMLTVFKSNKGAVRWYEKRGYIVDDFSPGPRILRNGTLKQPTYLILSKGYAQ